jgi:hypothetical protein
MSATSLAAVASNGGTLKSMSTRGTVSVGVVETAGGSGGSQVKTQGADSISHEPSTRTPPHGPNHIRFGQVGSNVVNRPLTFGIADVPAFIAGRVAS